MEKAQENSPRERWKWCHQELCTPSRPFSFMTPLKYTMQFEGQPQFHGPIRQRHHSLLPPLLSATKCSSQQPKRNLMSITSVSKKIKKRVTEYVSERTQLRTRKHRKQQLSLQ